MTTNRRTIGMSIYAAVVLAQLIAIPAAVAEALQTEFSGASVHVAWLAQPAPEVLPSGHLKIDGWEHLWYDDADDDRLDGYDTVVIKGVLGADGSLINAHGTFTVREKLDAFSFDDFLNGNFDLEGVVQGDVLFDGTFTITPAQGVHGVAMNSEGLKAFYSFPDPFAFPVLPFHGRLLDPHGAMGVAAVPEPSTAMIATVALLGFAGWLYRKRRGLRLAP